MGKFDGTARRGFDSVSGHLGPAVGFLAAGAVSAVFGLPPQAIVPLTVGGGIAGAFMGPVVVDGVVRIWPSAYKLHAMKRLRWVNGRLRWLDYAEWLLIDKLHRDFDQSPLPDRLEILDAGRDILHDIGSLGVIPTRFREDFDRLGELLPKFKRNTVLRRPSGAIGRLQRRTENLCAVCISVHPAVISTLLYMRDELQVPLSINHDYDYGLLAIRSAIDRITSSVPHDIMFLPDPAVLMAHNGNIPFDFTIDYRLMMPVLPMQHYIVRRRSKRLQEGLKGTNFTRFLQHSTGQKLFHRICHDVDIPLRELPYDIDNCSEILADVEDNVAVALWDPMHKYAIASGEFYEVKELRREYWLSMYGLRSSFSSNDASKDFIAAFIYSWYYCGSNLSYASDLLERESSVKNGFQRGIHSFDGKHS